MGRGIPKTTVIYLALKRNQPPVRFSGVGALGFGKGTLPPLVAEDSP